MKFLLEMGANPNLEDPEGNSAADLTMESDIRKVKCHVYFATLTFLAQLKTHGGWKE